MRRVLTALFSLAVRIFFRRIEVVGLERIPRSGPILIVLNHPNALIDPLFILCFSPRPVSFLAKEPLFRMPVVGTLIRAFDSLPVYRRQDGAAGARNDRTFAAARQRLRESGSIAIFPEGISHDGPRLAPLKTGAARIALGTGPEAPAPVIVPAGLFYTDKEIFRSDALLAFGDPIECPPVTLSPEGEPPPEAVRELTDRIGEALGRVTLQADHDRALRLVERAERIYSAADEAQGALEDTLGTRQRFVEGYETLRSRAPERLDALERRVARYESELDDLGLAPEQLSPKQLAPRPTLIRGLMSAVLLTLQAPMALIGLVTHWPTYRLVGVIASRLLPAQRDITSTIKLLGAMLFFPLTWIAWAITAAWFGGPGWAAVGLLLPLCGWVALRFGERLESLVGGSRALLFFLARGYEFARLRNERQSIRAEIEALGDIV